MYIAEHRELLKEQGREGVIGREEEGRMGIDEPEEEVRDPVFVFRWDVARTIHLMENILNDKVRGSKRCS